MANAAALFDLDRTLIAGTSLLPVGIEAWREGLADNAEIVKWAMAALVFNWGSSPAGSFCPHLCLLRYSSPPDAEKEYW